MNGLLAEISTVDQWMIGFTGLMSLATLGATVVMIVALNKKQEVRVETPLDVQVLEGYVGKQEFREQAADTAHELHELREILRREIPEMERRLSAAGEARVAKLHERLDAILAEVSRLEGVVHR